MPYNLDETDIAIVNSLMEDGRKSFRQISRELKISTPTVKFRYQRLVNIGLIKGVMPIIDTSKLEKKHESKLCHCHTEHDVSTMKLSKDMAVEMICEYCDGPIGAKPATLKFADIERFFCCNSCKSLYREKYNGKIESIIEKFQKVKGNALKSVIATGSFFAISGVCLDHGIRHVMHSVPILT